MACFENIAPRRMCAAGQLQPAASADLPPTFASGLYFQTKPSTCGLIPITRRQPLATGSQTIACRAYHVDSSTTLQAARTAEEIPPTTSERNSSVSARETNNKTSAKRIEQLLHRQISMCSSTRALIHAPIYWSSELPSYCYS